MLIQQALLGDVATSSGGGALTVFDYSGGFTSGNLTNTTLNHGTALVGTQVRLGGSSGHVAGGMFYNSLQPTSSFTTSFTFQFQDLSTPGFAVSGITFMIQNTVSPPGASGFTGVQFAGDANCCGYGCYDPAVLTSSQFPPEFSVAIKFDCGFWDQQVAPSTATPNSTGIYVYGGPFGGLCPANDLNPYGINFYTNHVMQANIVYDGSILTLVLLDTVTDAQARFQYSINIPACTTNSTSYVGFTEGQANTSTGAQTPAPAFLNGWKFSTGYNTRLTTPTANVSPGTYSTTQTVTLGAQSGASIYYTTNGLLPTSSSTLYSAPITVSANTNLQCIAIQSNFTDSFVGGGNYVIGSNRINYPSGFAANDGMILTGYTSFNGSAIQLTDSTNPDYSEAGNTWYSAALNITSFTTQFTIQLSGAQVYGMTFIICAPSAPAANAPNWGAISNAFSIGGSGASLGFGGIAGGQQASHGATSLGIQNSLAVKFDANGGNKTGVYTNGTIPGGSSGTTITGVTLSSGHPMLCTLTYTGGTSLALTIKDTTTSSTFTTTLTLSNTIQSIIGSSVGFVGFGAGTNGNNATTQLQNWTLT
jgi:hypothetical protein